MSTPRKKILYVITKSNWGGAQRYVYDLATAYAPDYDVVVGSIRCCEIIHIALGAAPIRFRNHVEYFFSWCGHMRYNSSIRMRVARAK